MRTGRTFVQTYRECGHALCRGAVQLGSTVLAGFDLDVWHFVCDETTGHWSWKRISPTGAHVAESPYSFASFRVCVADAERAGFNPTTTVVRRLRSSDLELKPTPHLERRRRPRDATTTAPADPEPR